MKQHAFRPSSHEISGLRTAVYLPGRVYACGILVPAPVHTIVNQRYCVLSRGMTARFCFCLCCCCLINIGDNGPIDWAIMYFEVSFGRHLCRCCSCCCCGLAETTTDTAVPLLYEHFTKMQSSVCNGCNRRRRTRHRFLASETSSMMRRRWRSSRRVFSVATWQKAKRSGNQKKGQTRNTAVVRLFLESVQRFPRKRRGRPDVPVKISGRD